MRARRLSVCILLSGLSLSLAPFAQFSLAEDKSPLVFVFQKQKKPDEIKAAADKVADYLSTELGRKVNAMVPSDYSASVQALVSKQADFAYTSSLPFLIARRDGGAKLLLAEQRLDSAGVPRTEYDSVFVVAKDSPLKSISDVVTRAPKLRMVFTSPTSTSGFVFANMRLVQEGVLKEKQDAKEVFKSVHFGGSYTQALSEVLEGRADVAAVSYYAVEGARSVAYLPKEKLDSLRVLARTPGVPTHIITARAGLEEELEQKVKAALLKLSNERPELLSDVYGTSKFVEVKESEHVAKTVEAVAALGLPLNGLVKKTH